MQTKENKMGTLPIPKLLLSMSVPMMLSMLVQAMYNIVDSIFVAQINEYAIRAVSLAFPIQSLMIAVGVGTAVGINSLLSRSLGQKQFEKAHRVAQNGVFVTVLCYVLFLILGFTLAEPFMRSQTNVPEVQQYGTTYLSICCIWSIGIFMQLTFERILQATGRAVHTMFMQLLGAIINIVLDPILIFGWFGFPAMGVAGAAIATVVGQIIAAVAGVILNLKLNHDVKLLLPGFRPSARIIKEIYAVGAPSIVVQAIGSVMSYGMNLILAAWGVAQTVFGLYFKLQSFIFMPVFGLTNSVVPIVGYNYGAGRKDRVLQTLRLGIIYAVVIMLVGLLIMQFFPAELLSLFNATPELLEIGIPALRIISIHFAFAGFCIVASSLFQALGNGLYSMIVSVARQMVVLLPAAYLLSLTGSVHNVWYAFPIAEIVSAVLSVFFLRHVCRTVVDRIGE